MSGSGSGSTASGGRNTSGDMGNDLEEYEPLIAAALAVAVLAFLFAVIMTIFFIVMFYFVVKLRKDVRSLRNGASPPSKAENGTSVAVTKEQESANELREYEREPSVTAPLPSSSPEPSKPESILHAPPGPGYEDADPQGSRGPPKGNYDLITSIIPPEMRTKENLEGRTFTEEEKERLREQERKKELNYEEMEMREKREEEAVTAARVLSKNPGGQGGEERGRDDVYYNPADAIDVEGVPVPGMGGRAAAENHKRFKLSSSQASEGNPGSYTDVFDQLPPGAKKVIGQKKSERALSDSSPLAERRQMGEAGAQRRPDPAGYEDIPEDVFQPAESVGKEMASSDPLSSSVGDLPTAQGDSPAEGRKGRGKADVTKRHSLPHSTRRDSSKEMVEVNPTSRKPVTLSSQRRKQKREHTDGGGGEGGEEGEGSESPDLGRKESEDGPLSKSAENSPSKNKSFSISSESSGGVQDSYALVDMAGKMRYRAESDSMKREGSGVPQHYTVKERPPEEQEESTKM